MAPSAINGCLPTNFMREPKSKEHPAFTTPKQIITYPTLWTPKAQEMYAWNRKRKRLILFSNLELMIDKISTWNLNNLFKKQNHIRAFFHDLVLC